MGASQIEIPGTSERVAQHSSSAANETIEAQMWERVSQLEGATREEIGERIEELRREWDIERVLEANAASIALLGIGLGTFVNRRWFALPAVVASFLLQHAVQGWCPPLPLFRKLGVRTAEEIHREILALKLMRGDFGQPTSAAVAMSRASLRASPVVH